MEKVINLAHARASSRRAAKFVSNSAETLADRAFSVARIDAHHSDGIQSRCHHLVTMPAEAPISEAIESRAPYASLGPQSSMTSLKDVIFDMPTSLGQFVPNGNASVSTDNIKLSGHTVLMSDDHEKLAETQWREEFRLRIIKARGDRTQAVMAELLGILTNTYGKYEAESRKSMMPVRLLPRFAKICGVDLLELIEGQRKIQVPAKPRLVKPVDKPKKRA